MSREDRWIPVNEKLPEESGEYLTTLYHEGVDGYYCSSVLFLTESPNYKGMKNFWLTWDRLDTVDMEVIAWMPLPQPYKEVKA